MINEQFIQKYIEDISRFTSTKDGTTRLSFTKEEQEARKYIKNVMKNIGLKVREDEAGTIIGRIDGINNSAPVVMIGSHYDTVGHGGNFDGVAGVAAALEIARELLHEGFSNYYPIEIVAMIEEEGIRFGVGLFASKAMAGMEEKVSLYNRKDKDGITLAQAMQTCGFNPDKFELAKREKASIKAFLELHIEQSIQLEREKKEIGIVDCVAGNRHMNVKIIGNADHAGGVPMSMRHDALVTAAKVVTEISSYIGKKGSGNVATVGKMDIYPNVRNVVPGQVSFMIDNRSTDSKQLDMTVEECHRIIADACKKNGCQYEIDELKKVEPVFFDTHLRCMLADSAKELGYTAMVLNSGAGHDAMIMSTIAPTAMVFIPSRKGKSHCKEEYSSYMDIKKGTEVLYQTVKHLVVYE